MWTKLAGELGIPTSRESGLANSDRSTWGIFARLSVALFPGTGLSTGVNVSESREHKASSNERFDVDPEAAVKEALTTLLDKKLRAVVVIDDYHFVESVDARRAIALALRPLTDKGLTVILCTIHAGQVDEAMVNTNLGGRRKRVMIKPWDLDELGQIATQGFPYLSVTTTEDVVKRLAGESFGSPQIMQQLLLDLCENVNGILEGEAGQPLADLKEPADWSDFFRSVEDEDAFNWLSGLTQGPNPRKSRSKRIHPGPPPKELDGYQLIMLALHEMGSPTEVPFSEVKQHIGQKLGLTATELNQLALELKARNLNEIASKDTRDALAAHALDDANANGDTNDDATGGDESADEKAAFAEMVAADAIPQPTFKVQGDQQAAKVSVLDPLLSYVIKWHPEIILESGR